MAEKSVPVMLVTGFLGAGKTTFLNHLLDSPASATMAVMVNDFGAINIDAQLLNALTLSQDMVQLSNGCICCTIREDWEHAILDLLKRDPAPERIIVESSGVTDAIDAVLILRAIAGVHIEAVFTIVDAEHILDTAKAHEILAMNQIGAGDLILLNKTDCVTAHHLETVTQFIRGIAKEARIISCEYGAVPLDVILDGEHQHNSAEVTHHHEHVSQFQSWSWASDALLDEKRVRRLVEGLPKTIYRAKGILRIADKNNTCLVLQMVGKRVRWTVVKGDDYTESRVVVIGVSGFDTDKLQTQFDQCIMRKSGLLKWF